MFIMDHFIIPAMTLKKILSDTNSTISDPLTSPNHHHHTPTRCDISIVPLLSCPLLLSNWSVAGMSDEPVFGLTTGTGC